jgi:ribosomal protein L7Ae-like RNA K-turn-binding protein
VSAREKRAFTVLGFGSTHDAMAAEALLKDLGVPVVAVPAPKEIGALCGIALRLEQEDDVRAKKLLARAQIAWTQEATVQDL